LASVKKPVNAAKRLQLQSKGYKMIVLPGLLV